MPPRRHFSLEKLTTESLILIGGGGHARACLDVIWSEQKFKVVGIVDLSDLVGTEVLGVPVIGTDADIPSLVTSSVSFLISLGQLTSSEPRMHIHCRLRALGARMPTIVAPTASVSPWAIVGEGTIVMHMALIGPGARIGENCIINTRALVEHDSEVGDHSHVSTGAIVNGNCRIGSGVFIGSSAVLKQGVQIGDRSVVGMGSCVRQNMGTF